MRLYKSSLLSRSSVPVTVAAESKWRLLYWVRLDNVKAGEIISINAKGHLVNNIYLNGKPLVVEGVVRLICTPSISIGNGDVDNFGQYMIEAGSGQNWSHQTSHYYEWRKATHYEFPADMLVAFIQTLARCRSEEAADGMFIEAGPASAGQLTVLRYAGGA